MAEDFGKQFAAMLVALNFTTPQYLIGCSEEEIEQLCVDQGVDFLPKVYRQFLLEMGHQCEFFIGEDISYPAVRNEKEAMKELAQEHAEYHENSFRVADDVFVFMGHHGIQFWYFHTSEKQDDPPVYGWGEGLPSSETDEPIRINEHLSEFFEACVSERLPHAYANYKQALSTNK